MADRGTPRICLSMIVRNERAILERCLSSALPLIDAAVICDTGSTDGTPDFASSYLREHQIPTRVATHPWQNFGLNRTAALAEAGAYIEASRWTAEQTYFLLLDADLELVVDGAFDRRTLKGDAWALQQRSASLSYWNPRLIRASLDWSVVGATHERYHSPVLPRFERMSGVWIRDHEDGGAKADKIERDIAWLSKQLEDSRDDPRTLFYLAQSYRGAGDPLKALVLYRRRIAIGDDHDEVWYSKLCVGAILAEGGALAPAVAALTEAHADQPSRAEPWYELSRLYQRHGLFEEALTAAERGRALPLPTATSFFVHTNVYEYQLDQEVARAAAAIGSHRRAMAACEKVALSRRASDSAVDEMRHTEVALASPLRGMQSRALQPVLESPYRACNPSILTTDAGYLVICRAVNYEQRRLRYRSLDADGIYRTRNILMRLDPSFRVLSEQEITIADPPLRMGAVRGLEDCRLVAADGIYFTCATTDRHPSGRVHQSLCRLDDSGQVVRHVALVGGVDTRHHKNWLPFVDGAGIRAIQGYDPLTVVALSLDNGAYDVAHEVVSPVNTRHWRGSAGPLRWPFAEDRQLVLVHEVVHRQGPDQGWERIYLHRFVEYDDRFSLRRVSFPFVFTHKGVEFACGMTRSHNQTDLILGFGVEDREAYIGRIPFTMVDTLLQEGTTA